MSEYVLTKEFVIDAFDEREVGHDLDGADVIIGRISVGSYEGQAFIAYRAEGVWHYVTSSHCSCNSFSWNPQATTLIGVLAAANEDWIGGPKVAAEILAHGNAYERATVLQREIARVNEIRGTDEKILAREELRELLSKQPPEVLVELDGLEGAPRGPQAPGGGA